MSSDSKSPKFPARLVAGTVSVALAIGAAVYWRSSHPSPSGSGGEGQHPAGTTRTGDRPGTGSVTGSHAGVRADERSPNLHVRDLADKLAQEFARDPSVLAARLADDDNKGLAYDIGRDLIVMFPDKTRELMEGFKATRPPELAADLCGRLVGSVAARGDADSALALAGGLDAGRNRTTAFMALGKNCPPESLAKVLEKARTGPVREDARQIETGLINRADSLSAQDLQSLLPLSLSEDTAQVLGNAYGRSLVTEKGRASALQEAMSLPGAEKSQAIYAVLNQGASQDGGGAWLLESLAKLDPAAPLDRKGLTTGYAQQLLRSSGQSAMDWAQAIPDPALREATVGGTVHSWLVLDSMAAGEWAGKQPAGPLKDAAISEIVTYLSSRGELQGARDWLSQVQDPAKKQALDQKAQTLAKGAPK